MPKCDFCKQETSSPVRARREFKTYAGESKYIYILACLDCFGRMDWVDGALEILGDDGEPLELERSQWREEQPRPEIAAPVKGRQMTIDEALQGKLFEEV